MQHGLATQGRQVAKKGIVAQFCMALLLICIAAIVNHHYLVAIIFGCFSFIIPHSIFAYWVFRYAGATKNEIVAQSFSQGMKIKLLLTSVFFIIAFSQFNVHPLPLLGAYAVVMVSQWLAMFCLTE